MNYLAHAWLAGKDELTVVGAVIADHVKGRLDEGLPSQLKCGIVQHRRLDSFVDQHPLSQKFLRLLPSSSRRYGGIFLDMAIDHLLAREWQRITTAGELQLFADHVYQLLNRHSSHWPKQFAQVYWRMQRYNWLGTYGEQGVLQIALKQVGTRVRGGEALAELADAAAPYLEWLEPQFDAFWDEVSQKAQVWLA